MSGTPQLFTPITLRGLEVSSRLWVAPMCQIRLRPSAE